MRRYYILLPGIHTDPADWRNWAPRFATAINLRFPDAKGDEFRYYALAVSQKGAQAERAGYVRALAGEAFSSGYDVVLVGHSNGCEIIRQAIDGCPAMIAEAHLIAGATSEDFSLDGWGGCLADGTVGRICAYVSRADGVLRVWARLGEWLGYGRLGYLGPRNVPVHLAGRVTVIERELDHCEWFSRENFDATFDAVTVGERMHGA